VATGPKIEKAEFVHRSKCRGRQHSAAVLNLLPSQFTSLLAGVIGDIKFSLGYDIPSDPNYLSPSRSFIFLAGSSLMTNPNTHTLMSIHAMYHYYVSSPTGIIPPWRPLLNLKWCGWIGGRSEIGDGH